MATLVTTKHIRKCRWVTGWKTVQEYKLNDVAENSDDEKRIRSARTQGTQTDETGEEVTILTISQTYTDSCDWLSCSVTFLWSSTAEQCPTDDKPNHSSSPFVQLAGAHRNQVTSATNVFKRDTGNQDALLSSAALRSLLKMKLIIKTNYGIYAVSTRHNVAQIDKI
ncbi:uncharacterized protein LOC128171041 [Crassostrea angulata]|uniref:uncharacterized protein LOC128171041 n=1 Tax=Magallana angulata TaxID=2784310 RepID=UPI0022B0E34E|nr:uncharacterized protein LOC128171041 [Crassostrea angulata]